MLHYCLHQISKQSIDFFFHFTVIIILYMARAAARIMFNLQLCGGCCFRRFSQQIFDMFDTKMGLPFRTICCNFRTCMYYARFSRFDTHNCQDGAFQYIRVCVCFFFQLDIAIILSNHCDIDHIDIEFHMSKMCVYDCICMFRNKCSTALKRCCKVKGLTV